MVLLFESRACRLTVIVGVLVLLGLSGACRKPASNAPSILASDEVIQELRETRPAFSELTASDQAIVYLWLNANCAIGGDDRRGDLLKAGARTEVALIEAYAMGPPVAVVGGLVERRRADYRAIVAQLQSGEDEFIAPEVKSRLLSRSGDAYVADGVEQTIAAYRLAALNGLAVVGSPTAAAWIQRKLPTIADADLRGAAERTLAIIHRRLGR